MGIRRLIKNIILILLFLIITTIIIGIFFNILYSDNHTNTIIVEDVDVVIEEDFIIKDIVIEENYITPNEIIIEDIIIEKETIIEDTHIIEEDILIENNIIIEDNDIITEKDVIIEENNIPETENVITTLRLIEINRTEPTIPIQSEIDRISGFNEHLIEHHIYELTNIERTNMGLSALSRVSIIDSIARDHSQDMSDRNYFDHINPDGETPTDRGVKVGYDCRKDYDTHYTFGLGENVAYDYTYDYYTTLLDGTILSYTWFDDEETVANEIVVGWMNSPGHRENILKPGYEKIGVGIFINNDEKVYATQNFC